MRIFKNSNCATEAFRASFFCTLFILSISNCVDAQDVDSVKETRLESVTVKAFEQQRKIKDLPAAVNYVGRETLERFGTSSTLEAINTTAGVRMEERSPGSYRLNIRGSSLRSPFGVRNVKVYYNDLPITDPGGNTYFNSLGYYDFSSVEIIKGPGSSVYGASTGGVMLVDAMDANEKPKVLVDLSAGSFGLRNAYASVTSGKDESTNKLGFQYQKTDGYRVQSAAEREILSWNGRFISSTKTVLKTTIFYSHLFYETPGGLTKSEFEADPKSARPAAGGFPSAQQNKASILENTFLAGLSLTQSFSKTFSNTTAAYGMFTELSNPAIRNYGQNEEPHAGGRTVFRFQKNLGRTKTSIVTGAEFQQSFPSVSVYKNRNGERDSLQTTDNIPVRQSLLFLQAALEKKGWELVAGGSLNDIKIKIDRSFPSPSSPQQRHFSNQLSPRVSLAKRWKGLTAYTSIARGFSPPNSAELFPSGSQINLSLNAETGMNYDLGIKGMINDLSFDVNAFLFRLQNSIVQRRDAGGGDYYINAGSTLQKGIETSLSYPFLKKFSSIRRSQFYVSHAWHQFHYKEFKQITTDYSGKQLPGTAPHTVSTGADVLMKSGWFFNLNYFFSDKIPLNDANSDYAAVYNLLHAKIGFEKNIGERWLLKLAVGGDNLLNEKYSLGNDINAAGGRYYNAAAPRNYYVSLTAQIRTNKLSE